MKLKMMAAIVGIGLIGTVVHFINSVYAENGRLIGENAALGKSLSEQIDINTQQQTRLKQLAELDTKHTQELANAKTEIDTLRADVAAGRRKLRIKANCPSVPNTVTSSSVVDATTVELSGATGSTVLDIRENIINDLAKLKYLQDYIKTECSL
ncbi:putative endopeptidase (Protein gp15) [Xenorhabdus poinarii G6]|uniref:Putative endopeptidase (Protein gp15) n=1 Tax=Xenorhabdus poinarii G6 TaxID=1354304 RepID=A0A068R1W1_9GAMM|nr:lysis protein [Xenorhabdus poinarii]CDG21049.1 putative endopeptidase (Protein gp15) [Xenorhabdus poinarii G6]